MAEQEKHEIQKAQNENSQIAKTQQITKEIAEQDEITGKLLNQQVSFIKSVFPTKADKKILEFQNKLVEQKANAKLESHRMFYEFQRQTIKETLDAVLIEGKGFVRSRTSSVFALQLSELEDNLRKLSDTHDVKMDEAFEKLDSIKAKPVRDKKEQFLLSLNDSFIEDLKKLLNRYRQILDELV